MSDNEFLTAMFGELPAELTRKTPADPNAPTITVKKMSQVVTVSAEDQADAEAFRQAVIDNHKRRAAMTPEERAAEDAEWEARRAREKAERTCPHCGCDPDEHGGD